jgi:hypothetical protein
MENLSFVKVNDAPADSELKIRLNKRDLNSQHHEVKPIAWIVIFSDTLHKFIG